MRDHTLPLYRQLSAQSGRTPTITPGADIQSATFNLASLLQVTDGKRNYLQNFVGRMTTTLDPDAAGSAVNWDALYKGMSAVRLYSPMMGDVYQAAHTRGALLGHFMQVLGGGYCYPQPARAQIPTNTDTDVTIDLYYVVPMSFEGFVKPHETSQYVGQFEGGELEFRVAASTVFDTDYAGAVIKAPTTLRAWYEYYPSPDNFIGVPFQFREYVVPGSNNEFVLRGVGGTSGLKGIANTGCGLVALAWLTDALGVGMGGADGVDEINRIDIPFRAQQSLDTIEPYFSSFRRMTGGRVGPVAGVGTAPIHDGAGYPYTMAATPNNSLANAQAMFLPLVMPGTNFETSKAQHVEGDLVINMGFGTLPTGSSRFVTLELLEWDIPQVKAMAQVMGLDPDAVRADRKAANGPMTEKQSRYTRILLSELDAA